MERRRAFGYASVLWRSVVVDAPRPTKMGNIASPWRNDAAASHARAPLKHPIAYDLALRPRAAIFQCHGRLGWALIHPRNRVYVGCRRKPGGQISAPSRLLLTQNGPRPLLAYWCEPQEVRTSGESPINSIGFLAAGPTPRGRSELFR